MTPPPSRRRRSVALAGVLVAGLIALAGGLALVLTGPRPSRAVVIRCPAAASAPAPGPQPGTIKAAPAVEIRLNQVGYVAGCPKLALVMSRGPLADPSFVLLRGAQVALRGRLGLSRGAWSPAWPYVYPLDLSAARTPGRYALSVAGRRSPSFLIGPGSSLYAAPTRDAVGFFAAQRDGPQVIPGTLHRVPSHLLDRRATVYAQPSYHGLTLVAPLRATGVKPW